MQHEPGFEEGVIYKENGDLKVSESRQVRKFLLERGRNDSKAAPNSFCSFGKLYFIYTSFTCGFFGLLTNHCPNQEVLRLLIADKEKESRTLEVCAA